MARPVKAKTVTEHQLTLLRMRQSIEIDRELEPRRKGRIRMKLNALLEELQKAPEQVPVVDTRVER